MTDAISSIEQLEACIGVAGLPVKMKIIDHLDGGARRWIANAPIAFAGFGRESGPVVTIAGGRPGFASTPDEATLVLPRDALDEDGDIEPGRGAGILFLVPGIGETLRANGRVKAVSAGQVEIAIEECFLHCAKALIRSGFWNAHPTDAPAEPTELLRATRFLALATMDAAGRLDVSPKGDPAELLIRAEANTATLAERPGNRLAFGYRNIIEQPAIAAVALLPGSASAAMISGRAHLSTDESHRNAFTVDGKAPILAMVIENAKIGSYESRAVARACLWAGAHHAPAIDPSAVLVGHVKLNKTRGAQALAIRAATNRLIVAKGLEAAYKNSLY